MGGCSRARSNLLGRSSASSLYLKYQNPLESHLQNPLESHLLLTSLPRASPVLEGDTHSRRSICAGGCMACTFSSVSQAVKKNKQISTHRLVTYSLHALILAVLCSGSSAYFQGLPACDWKALAGSALPPSSTWHIKPQTSVC